MYQNNPYSPPYYERQTPYPSYPNQANMGYYPHPRGFQRPLSKAFANFNYYHFLEGTQKTLTTVNQIIPIVTQVTPMIRNAATIFKVANVLNTMPLEATSLASGALVGSILNNKPQNPKESIDKPTFLVG